MARESSLEKGVSVRPAGLLLVLESVLLLSCSPMQSPSTSRPLPTRTKTSSSIQPSQPRSSQAQTSVREKYQFVPFMSAYNDWMENSSQNYLNQPIELMGGAINENEGLFYGGTFMASRAIRTDISNHSSSPVAQKYRTLRTQNVHDIEGVRLRLRGSFQRVDRQRLFVVQSGTMYYDGNSYDF